MVSGEFFHHSSFIIHHLLMIKLEIVTPERRVLDTTVDLVTIPTSSGEVGILPNHAPLISGLKSGILSYSVGVTTEKLVISGGFVEVGVNKVSVLTDIAENAGDINVEKAKLEQSEAEKALTGWSGSEEDLAIEQAKLERSQARLQLATGK
jgi:F-type H+-transporting ATPase subunit epsilon